MANLVRSLGLMTLFVGGCRTGEAPVAPAQPDAAGEASPTGLPASAEQQVADEPKVANGDPEPGATGPANTLSKADARARAEGIAALDEGRYTDARLAFEGLLERYPTNPALQGLHAAAAEAEVDQRNQAVGAYARMQPEVLVAPPWSYTLKTKVKVQPGAQPSLKKLSAVKNSITDDAEWFRDNGIKLPTWEVPSRYNGEQGNLPSNIPDKIGTHRIIRAISHEDHTVLIYGPDFSSGTILVVLDREGAVMGYFDFAAYRTAPRTKRGDESFVDQGVGWAQLQDGVLYVATGHNTYAASSGGDNAYLTALDATRGDILWRSQPLVAGAVNFLLHDGWIITGYGFTAEPDFLYLMRQSDGKVAKKVKLKTGPSYFAKKGNRLLVRTYDMNYEFAL